MANPIKERPSEQIFTELSQMGAPVNGALWIFMRDLVLRADKTLTNKGEIQAQANVTGRTEKLSTTLGNVDATGIVTAAGVDLSRAYTNKTVDNINDGVTFVRTTPNEKTGAGRGFNALDTNNRLANSFRANPVNVSNAPSSSTTMSNDGVSTSIPVSAFTNQFPAGAVAYNSGSFDPGSFGKVFGYFDDSTFAGGAVPYQFTTLPQVQTAAEGRIPLGGITTVNGSAKTGGGTSGGTGGTGGGRGFING